jgi:hypothetical protein
VSEGELEALEQQVAKQETASAQAVAEYRPVIPGRIDDLESPAAEILRQLPGVVQVEELVRCEKPTHRIIHLRDWHFVPRVSYALDMNGVYGRVLDEAEFDRLYRRLLLEVELVQSEEMAILRCLIQHHGLKRVYGEGFSPSELSAYRERISVLKSIEAEHIPRIRHQLAEVQDILKTATGERRKEAQAIESKLQKMLAEHKALLLEMGGAGRLLISGELEDVLPLDEAEALDQANPIAADGSVEHDPSKIEARHDAQVQLLMKGQPVALIVLGGAHDLSKSVRRHGGCEYLRMTTKWFSEIEE